MTTVAHFQVMNADLGLSQQGAVDPRASLLWGTDAAGKLVSFLGLRPWVLTVSAWSL